MDANTKLASRKEVCGEVGREMGKGNGTGKTAKGSADANGAKFERIRRRFVQCKEVGAAEGRCDGWWEGAVENKLQ